MAPTAVVGTAPTRNRHVTPRSISARFHQMRERLPRSIVTVSTGAVARMPSVKAISGSTITPAPKPATPATTEPISAPATRIDQPRASGTMLTVVYAGESLGRRRRGVRDLARFDGQHRVPGDGVDLRGLRFGDALGHRLLRPQLRAALVRRWRPRRSHRIPAGLRGGARGERRRLCRRRDRSDIRVAAG